MYELSTVPYPAPIKGALVTLRLDLWVKRKFQKQNNLYRDKVSDLQGNLLKVVTFDYIPSAIKQSSATDDDSGYKKGLEIEVFLLLLLIEPRYLFRWTRLLRFVVLGFEITWKRYELYPNYIRTNKLAY